MAKKAEKAKKEEKRTLTRTLQGNVVKVSTANTGTVRVERKYPHPKYGKIIKSHKKYLVDLNNIEVAAGDVVTIAETKPISKNKSWQIIEKLTN